MNSGVVRLLSAYICWGLLPLYLRLLRQASSLEIVCHRVLWSMLLLLVYLFLVKGVRHLTTQLSWNLVGVYALAAALISLNWGAYIWGVHNGQAIEVSLGYFIMPLVSVFIGRVFFNERLNPSQTAGVALAASGVVYLCLRSDTVPWIAFIVALSFGSYGLVKKKAALPAAQGLAIETTILAIPAIMLLTWLAWHNDLAFHNRSVQLDLLLIGTGIVTVVPLLLFASAAKKTSLSTIGMLQYVSPTLQFLVGYYVFREPLPGPKLVGFIVIWIGLTFYLYTDLKATFGQRSH